MGFISITRALRRWSRGSNNGGRNEPVMCEDRRALFQKINLKGKEPTVAYSLNPTAWQWWLWLGGRIVGVVIGLWLDISFVAGKVFDERLYDFHQLAKPEIEELIEEELEHHESGHVTDARIDVIENHNASVDIQLEGIEKQLEKAEILMEKMDKKLDVVIRNGKAHDS